MAGGYAVDGWVAQEILHPELGNPKTRVGRTAQPRRANARPRPDWSALEPPNPLVVKMVGTLFEVEAECGLKRSASMMQVCARPWSSSPAGPVNDSPVYVSTVSRVAAPATVAAAAVAGWLSSRRPGPLASNDA